MSSDKLVVGLTGGIGSGKSTVADLFSDRGVDVIDTDRLARVLTEPGQPAYQAIIEHLGSHILMENKHINRMKLRRHIFADEKERRWLEQLLHPLIREEITRLVQLSTAPYTMVVIPLLFETEPNPIIQRILVIDTQEALQISRTQVRDVQLPIEVEAIIKTQAARETRLAGAHDVITNDGTRADLIPQVDKLHNFYLTLGTSSS